MKTALIFWFFGSNQRTIKNVSQKVRKLQAKNKDILYIFGLFH